MLISLIVHTYGPLTKNVHGRRNFFFLMYVALPILTHIAHTNTQTYTHKHTHTCMPPALTPWHSTEKSLITKSLEMLSSFNYRNKQNKKKYMLNLPNHKQKKDNKIRNYVIYSAYAATVSFHLKEPLTHLQANNHAKSFSA